MSKRIMIVEACRTALGKFQGQYTHTSGMELSAQVVKHLSTHMPYNKNPGCVMWGCVLQAGIGQAPARQIVQNGALPLATEAFTINEVCGSGLRAIIEGAQYLTCHTETPWVIAGGSENMSQAPYAMPRHRKKMGHETLKDTMIHDGLTNSTDQRLMMHLADESAKQYPFSQTDHNAYVLQSYHNYLQGHHTYIDTAFQDECPLSVKEEKIPLLKPLNPEGILTVAHCSSLADGAAGVLMMRENTTHPALGYIKGWQSHYENPENFAVAPVQAIQKLCRRLNWAPQDIPVWEINEAFSITPLSCMYTLSLKPETINMWGGACTLGHPLGATGSRIVVTLLQIMAHHNLERGVAALCIGGGGALALALERN